MKLPSAPFGITSLDVDSWLVPAGDGPSDRVRLAEESTGELDFCLVAQRTETGYVRTWPRWLRDRRTLLLHACALVSLAACSPALSVQTSVQTPLLTPTAPTVVISATSLARGAESTMVPTVIPATTTPIPVVDTATPEPPTQLPATSTVGAPSPTPTIPSPTATIEPSPTASAALIVTANTSLNLRSGPGMSFSIVKILDPGEKVVELSKSAARDWWQVRTADGSSGWVLANLVAASSLDASTPVVTSKSSSAVAPSPTAGPQASATSPAPAATPSAPAAPLSSTAAPPTPVVAAPADSTISAAHLGHISAIGDSVMLGAAPELRLILGDVDVDAAVSRQVSTAIGILSARRSSGQLGGIVVVHLGTNGTFTSGQFDQMMRILSGEQRVVFVNVHAARSWEAGDNATLAAGVTRYGNTRLVDWHGASAGQNAFFAGDGIHMRPEGAAVYARLIAAAIAAP